MNNADKERVTWRQIIELNRGAVRHADGGTVHGWLILQAAIGQSMSKSAT